MQKNRKKGIRILGLFLAVFSIAMSHKFCFAYQIIQITDNEYLDDYPAISDGQIVWLGNHTNITADRDVFLFKNGHVVRLTNDIDYFKNDFACAIHEGMVTWQRDAREIDLFDGTETKVLISSPNHVNEMSPTIFDGKVAWLHWDILGGKPIQIYY
ncbi:MAG: hypothetical protein ACM3L6_01745, partial [Deltaproteobacteria bacterium]